MRFSEFAKQLDERQIVAMYQQAHTSVELVRMFNTALLDNISTIADLPAGAYGLYNSGENRKILPPETENALIGWGRVGRHNLDMLPKRLIQQYYPQIPAGAINDSDTIHVNVRRILREVPNKAERILHIAATIVHEATHEYERETKGQTSETSAYAAERAFFSWVRNNWTMLIQRFPDLRETSGPELHPATQGQPPLPATH